MDETNAIEFETLYLLPGIFYNPRRSLFWFYPLGYHCNEMKHAFIFGTTCFCYHYIFVTSRKLPLWFYHSGCISSTVTDIEMKVVVVLGTPCILQKIVLRPGKSNLNAASFMTSWEPYNLAYRARDIPRG